MKRILAALAITSTLVVTAGCASEVNGSHLENSFIEPANAVATLTVPAKVTNKAPIALAIDVKDKEGKLIANFDKFQEQLMHLIVVSNDLQSFNHIILHIISEILFLGF